MSNEIRVDFESQGKRAIYEQAPLFSDTLLDAGTDRGVVLLTLHSWKRQKGAYFMKHVISVGIQMT